MSSPVLRLFPVPTVFLVALVGLAAPAQADSSAVLSVSETTLTPGSSGVLRLTLTSAEAEVSGVQLDLAFDSGTLNVRARTAMPESAPKTLYSSDIDGGRRFLVVGPDQSRIPDGAVVELTVTVGSDASASTYPVRLLNAIATDATGTEVPVTMRSGSVTINHSAPLHVERICNSASFAAGPVVPGELVCIMGSGFTEPLTVSVNGTRAPILHIGPNQVNAVIPYSVAGAGPASVLVESADRRASFDVPVGQAAPGIFTANGAGTGQGAFLNEDMTLNSSENPAGIGSIVAMFVTGVGQTDPASVDGSTEQSTAIRSVLPIAAEIDGKEAEVLYAGPAPGLISGVFQINFRIPDVAAGSRAASAFILVGGIRSQAGVTLSIR